MSLIMITKIRKLKLALHQNFNVAKGTIIIVIPWQSLDIFLESDGSVLCEKFT